jgi:transposase-like protein
MQPYTESMKARMIKRLTGPNAMTASALADETGIPQPTLSRWLRAAGIVATVTRERKPSAPKEASTSRNRRAQDWTMKDKLRVVLEASELSEDELGAFLRREGLHREQLEQWRAAAADALGRAPARRRRKQGPTPEEKRIRELERQLRHKEKALAEAAALLVLKKKYEVLFTDEDDNTDPTSDE